MRVISTKEFINECNTDNVAAVSISSNEVTVLFMVDYWQDPTTNNNEPFDCGDDQYRFYKFGSNNVFNDWTLDSSILTVEGLIEAITFQQGYCCGGLYFYHEADDREGYKNVYEHFYETVSCEAGREDVPILEMTKEEWKTFWPFLCDGIHIIIVTD